MFQSFFKQARPREFRYNFRYYQPEPEDEKKVHSHTKSLASWGRKTPPKTAREEIYYRADDMARSFWKAGSTCRVWANRVFSLRVPAPSRSGRFCPETRPHKAFCRKRSPDFPSGLRTKRRGERRIGAEDAVPGWSPTRFRT